MNRDDQEKLFDNIANDFNIFLNKYIENDNSNTSAVLAITLSYSIQTIFNSTDDLDKAKNFIKDVISDTVKKWEEQNGNKN